MIKKGFTLQETMITLAIIGIVAAITVPRLAKLAPDENHAKYLKAHALLTSITNEMLVDPALYFCNDQDGLDCLSVPKQGSVPNDLFQTLSQLSQTGDDWTPLNKYFSIFASKIHVQENDIAIIDNAAGDAARALRAKDGIVWIFAHDGRNNSPIQVDIDLDGISNNPNNDNNFFDNNNEIPDRFSFDVSMDGSITAADQMGQFYLDNSDNVNGKTRDKINSVQWQQNEARWRQSLNVSKACSDGPAGAPVCRGS